MKLRDPLSQDVTPQWEAGLYDESATLLGLNYPDQESAMRAVESAVTDDYASGYVALRRPPTESGRRPCWHYAPGVDSPAWSELFPDT